MPGIRLKYKMRLEVAESARRELPKGMDSGSKYRRGSKMKVPGIQLGQWEQRRTGRMRHTTIF